MSYHTSCFSLRARINSVAFVDLFGGGIKTEFRCEASICKRELVGHVKNITASSTSNRVQEGVILASI